MSSASNDEELPVAAAICGLAGTDREVLKTLRERFGLRLTALTRGERGALLLSASGFAECEGFAVHVEDTVGAGDAFTAAMTMGRLRGRDLDVIVRQACHVASFVCTQSGATPHLPDEYQA
jgi:fructokinase